MTTSLSPSAWSLCPLGPRRRELTDLGPLMRPLQREQGRGQHSVEGTGALRPLLALQLLSWEVWGGMSGFSEPRSPCM